MSYREFKEILRDLPKKPVKTIILIVLIIVIIWSKAFISEKGRQSAQKKPNEAEIVKLDTLRPDSSKKKFNDDIIDKIKKQLPITPPVLKEEEKVTFVVRVNLNREGAMLYLDGKLLGEVPGTFTTFKGLHELKLAKDVYGDTLIYKNNIYIEDNKIFWIDSDSWTKK